MKYSLYHIFITYVFSFTYTHTVGYVKRYVYNFEKLVYVFTNTFFYIWKFLILHIILLWYLWLLTQESKSDWVLFPRIRIILDNEEFIESCWQTYWIKNYGGKPMTFKILSLPSASEQKLFLAHSVAKKGNNLLLWVLIH